MSNPLWQNAKIIEIVDLTENVKKFFLQPETPVDFSPGQFVVLELPIDEKRNKRWRSYSMANTPNEKGIIELCISRQVNGLGTSYLFDIAEEGEDLWMKRPDGVFTLPEDAPHVVMICTGTGVVPFRSMILDWEDKKSDQSIHLIFGTRYGRNILYAGDFIDTERSNKKFSYDVVLSREEIDQFHSGYVHDIYREKYKNDESSVFMVCGWTEMVEEAEKILTEEMGIDSSRVYIENYN